MNKDVLIIAHFCSDFDEKGNNRFNYLADFIANNNFNVELVTSNFSHNKKVKREKKIQGDLNYKVTFIDEPEYKKNISLRRFYSHYMMSRRLEKYLKDRKRPDVIYCAIPSLDLAEVTAKYAKKNNIKFILDIQDLWPEAFKMVFNIPIISDFIFYPMEKQANNIYSLADEIIAVSQTYVDRALKNNNKCKSGNSVYLGTDLNKFDNIARNNRFKDKPVNEIWLAYIGTLGHSYDLISVIDALKIIKDKGIINIKFIIMGDGPLKSKFEEYSKEKDIYVEFTGRLPYEEMVGILTVCDIAVNPIKKGSAGSIINKVGDYSAAGLPVINTQECEEYIGLLNEYNAGISCICEDAKDISDKIHYLYNNNNLRKKLGNNNRLLAEEKFDRGITYKEIIKLL